MHPIEHLRYVARAHYYDPCEAASDAAFALIALSSDPKGMLVGCRLLVEYHPDNAPMWWVCARAVTSLEPRRILRESLEILHEVDREGSSPWEMPLQDLWRQYPDAVQLLKNSSTI